jgi:hypothetical protein
VATTFDEGATMGDVTGAADSGSGTPESDKWFFAGRWYAATVASDAMRDGLGLELDDIAPSPGRGLVLEAFRSDTTGETSFTALTTEPLPLDLVERFVGEARRVL